MEIGDFVPVTAGRSVADRFDAAAATYAEATTIQREVANALAQAVLQAGVPAHGRAVEFGCGTGYLTEALLRGLQPSSWLATDIAPAMLSNLRGRLEHPALQTACIDAADPGLPSGFDLACSSLALQWLAAPGEAVARWRQLVKPGGLLAVATLVQGSFSEWRTALQQAGAPEPGPIFPSIDTLSSWFGPRAHIEASTLQERHPTGLAFLKAARSSGIDAAETRALGAGVMRRAIEAFKDAGHTITYRVAVVLDRA